MPRILAFDQSISNCGFSVYDGGDERLIVCGSFSAAEGKDSLDKRVRFGRRVKQLIGLYRPAFVAFEQARQKIMVYPKKGGGDLLKKAAVPSLSTVNANQLILPGIESQLVQACIDYSIPFDCVAPNVWRKAILGRGDLSTDDAKAAAILHCRLLKIRAANHDEAEAALIGVWANRCSMRYRAVREGVRA